MTEFGVAKKPEGNPLIAGMMAVGPGTRGSLCSKWNNCLLGMIEIVDYSVVRMDERLTEEQKKNITMLVADRGDAYVLPPIKEIYGTAWRDEMLCRLDDIKPDIVLVPDCDEEFESGILQDIDKLWKSDACGLMFDFLVPGQEMSYPKEPHMKAFKWLTKLTYDQGGGGRWRIIPGTYACNKKYPKIKAKSKISHWVESQPGQMKILAKPKIDPDVVTVTVSVSGKSVAGCLQELAKTLKKFGR